MSTTIPAADALSLRSLIAPEPARMLLIMLREGSADTIQR
jgi:hypothetical protein